MVISALKAQFTLQILLKGKGNKNFLWREVNKMLRQTTNFVHNCVELFAPVRTL